MKNFFLFFSLLVIAAEGNKYGRKKDPSELLARLNRKYKINLASTTTKTVTSSEVSHILRPSSSTTSSSYSSSTSTTINPMKTSSTVVPYAAINETNTLVKNNSSLSLSTNTPPSNSRLNRFVRKNTSLLLDRLKTTFNVSKVVITTVKPIQTSSPVVHLLDKYVRLPNSTAEIERLSETSTTVNSTNQMINSDEMSVLTQGKIIVMILMIVSLIYSKNHIIIAFSI